METLLFVTFAGLFIYGFFMSSQGRDILKVAFESFAPPPEETMKAKARKRLEERMAIEGRRDSFGLRQR
jgi:hypothetical protein